ncbi:hypothetical protein BD413DRAFT_481183 [Trametes elegans]|nr:hypothetical protein BD413DRAFT_481183 [Trametes elegans]
MGIPALPSSRAMRGITHLPDDVLLDIFTLLPSRDLIHLLSSCRALHELTGDEASWRFLSSQYGLRDIQYFGGRSWFTIYTRLLHTYGPMLGMWAGDHPYTGGVIEIGLHPGVADNPGGIVVDLLRFRSLQPEDLDVPETPELPAYIRLAKIDFSTTPTLSGPPDFICCCNKRAPRHRAWFELFSSSTRGFYLQTRQGQYQHPDLPSAESHSWVEDSRYPRLPCIELEDVDQTTQVPPRPRVPIVYTAPTAYRKPPTISLSCELGCIAHARPFLGFEDISPAPPRFYPLRHHASPYLNPTSADWSPGMLEGLWLGSHGPHGTECLYIDIERSSHSAELRAWKITGDENVPRGAISWRVGVKTPYQLSVGHRQLCERLLGDLDGHVFFDGTGTYSGRGFLPHHRETVSVVLAVGQTEMLRVVWDGEEASAYIRYARRGTHPT